MEYTKKNSTGNPKSMSGQSAIIMKFIQGLQEVL